MKCFNWKIVAALAAAGVGLWAIAPGLATAVLPLLVLAACPLSMVLMMRTMNSTGEGCGRPEPAAGEQIQALRAEVAALRAERPSELDDLRSEIARTDRGPGAS